MSEKEITLNGVVYVPKDSYPAKDHKGLKYCIVRCKDAGVHSGFVAE